MIPILHASVLSVLCGFCFQLPAAEPNPQRLLYVATPGIRNHLEFGGHGVLVFDIDHNHKFVRRIASGGIGKDGKPMNVPPLITAAVRA